MIGKSGL